ncbi:MAG: hypothetical protein O7G83_10735, partial [Proteobacteria bacterium]|nr:hypothetical protein [Pseudomonadota bacterium]
YRKINQTEDKKGFSNAGGAGIYQVDSFWSRYSHVTNLCSTDDHHFLQCAPDFREASARLCNKLDF